MKRELLILLIIAAFALIGDQFWLAYGVDCRCAGCCWGCFADCDTNLGFPLVYYSSGVRTGGAVSFLSWQSLVVDLIVILGLGVVTVSSKVTWRKAKLTAIAVGALVLHGVFSRLLL